MDRRLLTVCSLFLAVLSLIACGGGDTQPAASKDAQPAASLQVVEQREIHTPQARILALSPDGHTAPYQLLGQMLNTPAPQRERSVPEREIVGAVVLLEPLHLRYHAAD